MADRTDGYGQPHGPTRPWGALREPAAPYPPGITLDTSLPIRPVAELPTEPATPPPLGGYEATQAVRPGDFKGGADGTGSVVEAGQAPVDPRAAVLTEAYWRLRDHAAAYRDTKLFRAARQRWEASDRSDERLHRKVVVHEFYVRGVEAAARDIAEMLGVPEHEIERPASAPAPTE